MRAAIALSFAFAAFAVAQDISSLPTCVQTCLTSSLSSSGTTCSPSDIQCLCSSTVYQTAAATCILGTCSASDQQAAEAYSTQACGGGGSGISATSVPASASSARSSVLSSVSSAVSSRASQLSSARSSGLSSVSSAASSAASVVSSSSSAAASPSSSSNSSAGKVQVGLAGVFGAAVAAAFL